MAETHSVSVNLSGAELEMHGVSVNLSGAELEPGGNVLEIRGSVASNGVFISVDFTPRVSVILPGFDDDAVSAARLMAAKLNELADEAERKVAIGFGVPVERAK